MDRMRAASPGFVTVELPGGGGELPGVPKRYPLVMTNITMENHRKTIGKP